MLDPRRVLTFREVALQRSFSRAGEALSLTQSAVSQQVAALERQPAPRCCIAAAAACASRAAGETLLEHPSRLRAAAARGPPARRLWPTTSAASCARSVPQRTGHDRARCRRRGCCARIRGWSRRREGGSTSWSPRPRRRACTSRCASRTPPHRDASTPARAAATCSRSRWSSRSRRVTGSQGEADPHRRPRRRPLVAPSTTASSPAPAERPGSSRASRSRPATRSRSGRWSSRPAVTLTSRLLAGQLDGCTSPRLKVSRSARPLRAAPRQRRAAG